MTMRRFTHFFRPPMLMRGSKQVENRANGAKDAFERARSELYRLTL